MAVDFRCRHCGKLLKVDIKPGSVFQCPFCRKCIALPAGLASLATPKMPEDLPGRAPQAGDPGIGDGGGMVALVLAQAMPWVISALFHMGLGLTMVLTVMIVIHNRLPEHVIVPDAYLSDNPGGVMNPGQSETELQAQQPKATDKRFTSRRERDIPVDTGKTDKKIELIGVGAGGMTGGALARMGLNRGGTDRGPRSSFFGSGGNAYHVVFVVDHSGSMLDSYHIVHREMLRTISRMKPPQDFHVILFGQDKAIESPARRLVLADRKNKQKSAEFLMGVGKPLGATRALPAMERAFEVLAKTNKMPGKLIYLLTDGNFDGVAGLGDGTTYRAGDKTYYGDKAVVQWLRDHNKSKAVQINAYLFEFNDDSAVEVMMTIAQENGGTYKNVSMDE